MLEHTDEQLGRLVDLLEGRGLLDDTVLMVLSDNGASREGGPLGVMDEFSFFNAAWEDIDELVDTRLDDIGGPPTPSHYHWGGAQARNSQPRWSQQHHSGRGAPAPPIRTWDHRRKR